MDGECEPTVVSEVVVERTFPIGVNLISRFSPVIGSITSLASSKSVKVFLILNGLILSLLNEVLKNLRHLVVVVRIDACDGPRSIGECSVSSSRQPVACCSECRWQLPRADSPFNQQLNQTCHQTR